MGRFKRYIFLSYLFFLSGFKRAEFLKKRKYFKSQGDNCYFQPWNFGTEPNLISFGNNVHLASGVTFINHDITAMMFSTIDSCSYKNRVGDIFIGNNVFIGAKSIILYDISIGDNVIIGAGSVVTKDIPSGVVAAGIPCRIIGNFETYKNKIVKGTNFGRI